MSGHKKVTMELDEWLAHNRLNLNLDEYLAEFGIEEVEDLDVLFADADLVKKCKAGMSREDRIAFVQAYNAHKGGGVTETLRKFSSSVWKGLSELSVSGGSRSEPKSGKVDGQKKRSCKVSVLDKKLTKAASMDLLFMLDCTGSMRPYIDAAKTRVRTFVQTLGETYPDIPLRIGFVGYRDIFDSQRVTTLPFQTSLGVFEGQLNVVRANGGQILTDLTSALKVASELDWSSAIRVLFHVGDYPCRGYDYHNLPEYEVKPPGDPRGHKPEAFVRALADKKVNYHFGQLTHHTDKMIAVLNARVGSEYIKSEPMNSTTMMEVITSNVIALLSTTLSSSSSTDSSASLVPRENNLVQEMPAWSAVPAERAVAFSLLQVDSVLSLCDDGAGSAKVLEDFPDSAPVHMRCAENPFGKGRSKLAYYAQTASPAAKDVPECVLKQSVYSTRCYGTKEKFEEFLAPQRAAIFLSDAFNKARPADTPTVEFVPTRLVQFLARPDRPYYIEEKLISGEWERYNNNTGYCAPFPTPLGTNHRAVQAFSHWTHHMSGQRLMVVDCQGCFNAARNAFLLTDPAVHCTNLLAYGGTNMGKKGFERFFKTHRCNDICRALGVPAAAAAAAPGTA